ncbi:MAG: B12-binding domain-containing radical SAM protein [Deltaproteobacteria bacterium]
MRSPSVLVLEMAASGRGSGWYDRHVKLPNFSGVMAQVVAVWCRELGASVSYRTFTGNEPLDRLLVGQWDIVFISAYTQTAWAAYAIGRHCSRRGAVTVLGGPHAQAWPDDARRFFDYVVGNADRNLVGRIMDERQRARDAGGERVSAPKPPRSLPGLRQRAPFLALAVRKAHLVHSIPVLGSIGCPYACEFCSDASVAFQPLSPEGIEDDVRFALEAFPRAVLFWHDPSFGVRFDDVLDAIERGLAGRRIRFGAEAPLALLAPARIARLARAGFVALLPGIEGWLRADPKLGHGRLTGWDKLRETAGQVEELLQAVPYVQANFIFGLEDETEEAYELTRAFVDRLPGAWPNYNLMTAYGESSPLGSRLQREDRVLPVPFPLLDQKHCPNVVLPAPSLRRLFPSLCRLVEHSSGRRMAIRRARAGKGWTVRLINLLRARGREQRCRLAWYRAMGEWLARDREFCRFFEGERVPVPVQLREAALRRLGPFRALLTQGELTDLLRGPAPPGRADALGGRTPRPFADPAYTSDVTH